MKVSNILFQDAMVRANNEGTKNQTRRLLKGVPNDAVFASVDPYRTDHSNLSPRGLFYKSDRYRAGEVKLKFAIGDVVWVREAWCAIGDNGGLLRDQDFSWHEGPQDVKFRADNNEIDNAMLKFRPSIFMPRWASRTTIVINEIKVERLLDISEQDAINEGITEHYGVIGHNSIGTEENGYRYFYENCYEEGFKEAGEAYFDLWDSINGKNNHKSNPWVVAFGYTVIQQNVDDYLKAVK